jgi:hypothetical protein
MAKMSEEDLDEIIKRDLPGFKVAKRIDRLDSQAAETDPDARSPLIDELRRKFLGRSRQADDNDSALDSHGSRAGDTDSDDEIEDEIVAVEPDSGTDPTDQRSHSKVAVVSGKDQRVIGTQG